MFQVRLIKTEADHRAALARIDQLMDIDDDPRAADELELLATLVENYEDEQFPMDLPSPVAAIRFRMDQEGLTNKDLVPYLGTSGKVSDVLSGKRPLSLRMIRALHKHLGIPAEVLIQEPNGIIPEETEGIDWDAFPVVELARRKWVKFRHDAERAMNDLIARAGGFEAVARPAFRKNDGSRRNAKMDGQALTAWCVYVLSEALRCKPKRPYKSGTITPEFLRAVAKLSPFDDGPKRAVSFLGENGIAVVVAPHLPNTYLDGAAMRSADGTPVVGLTVRFDRLDNFWFCLLHELAHIGRHMCAKESFSFVDDLNLRADDKEEKEADAWAEEALIPAAAWKRHPVRTTPTPANVMSLAQQLGIHHAIVAGRVRFQAKNWHLLTQLIGKDEVRKHFGNLWD
jgi:HTH-type transcriptional regulator / antitoxin HigA